MLSVDDNHSYFSFRKFVMQCVLLGFGFCISSLGSWLCFKSRGDHDVNGMFHEIKMDLVASL